MISDVENECNTLTFLGNCSFMDCDKITKVYEVDSVVYMGTRAFSGCTSLTQISLLKLRIAYSYVFERCTSLYSLTLDKLEHADSYAMS